MSKSSVDILSSASIKLVSIRPNKDMFYGKPYGGAMDHHAACAANLLLKQKESLTVIECSLKSVRLKFNQDLIISISGADMGWRKNDKLINTSKPIKVKSGQMISGGFAKEGLRTYIAFDKVIKSIDQKKIVIGKENKKIEHKTNTAYSINTNTTINIRRGPEWNYLSQEGKETMINYQGSMSQDLDRMGAYLIGPNVQLKSNFPKTSVCTFPGVIQLLPNGQLIVLLQDAQTTGGYPRIAYLDSSALHQFNQLPPGKKIKWRLTL